MLQPLYQNIKPNTSTLNYSFVFNIFCNNNSRYYNPSLYQIWNHKLGNPCHEVLKHVLKLYNIQILNKSMTDFCNVCCMGKVHKLPFTNLTTNSSPKNNLDTSANSNSTANPTPMNSINSSINSSNTSNLATNSFSKNNSNSIKTTILIPTQVRT